MKIKALVMDVDGTLTDGRIYIGRDGEVMKAFDVKDGYGIVHFRQCGGIPVIITGRRSAIVEQRCLELGISELHQGVNDKRSKLVEVMEKLGVSKEETAYIGDDLNDIECFSCVGISACPADSVESVRTAADYVCTQPGGRGAVREVGDYLLR